MTVLGPSWAVTHTDLGLINTKQCACAWQMSAGSCHYQGCSQWVPSSQKNTAMFLGWKAGAYCIANDEFCELFSPAKTQKWEGSALVSKLGNPPGSRIICSVTLCTSSLCSSSYLLNSTCPGFCDALMLLTSPMVASEIWGRSSGLRSRGHSFLQHVLSWALLWNQGGSKPHSINGSSWISCFELYRGKLQPRLSCGSCYKLALSDILHCTLVLQVHTRHYFSPGPMADSALDCNIKTQTRKSWCLQGKYMQQYLYALSSYKCNVLSSS